MCGFIVNFSWHWELLDQIYAGTESVKDDVTFLQTMSEDDISKKVKFIWNPDVKLYIQSLGHIVGASVLLFWEDQLIQVKADGQNFTSIVTTFKLCDM